jgi:hypothetical protein
MITKERILEQLTNMKPPFRPYNVNQYWGSVYFEEVCFLTADQLYTKLLECYKAATERNPFVREFKVSDSMLITYTKDVFIRWFYMYFRHIRWRFSSPILTVKDKVHAALHYRLKMKEMINGFNHFLNFNWNMDSDWTVHGMVYRVKDTYKDFNRG